MKYSDHFIQQVLQSEFVKKLTEGTVLIDNSEFTQWDGCFAAGVYNGALRRMSTSRRTPLIFGSAVHKGLESYFKGEKDWLAKAFAEAAAEGLDEAGDPKRNTTRLEDLLSSYVLEYERNASMRFDILKIDSLPAVEQSFVVPLGTVALDKQLFGHSKLEINWAGKIDLLTHYENMIAPVDHKTTTVMGEKFVDDKVRSSQCLGYTFAARYLADNLFGGQQVYGVRINALAQRSSGFEFKQFAIPLADWKIAEWQSETILSIKYKLEEIQHFLETGEIAPTREHCVTKYGKCQYFDVCDASAAMRDRMIFDESYFYISDWSPLNE